MFKFSQRFLLVEDTSILVNCLYTAYGSSVWALSLFSLLLLAPGIALGDARYSQWVDYEDADTELDEGSNHDDGLEDSLLNLSQGERREEARRGVGFSLLGGARWQNSEVFFADNPGGHELRLYQLGHGTAVFHGAKDGQRYEHDLRVFSLNGRLLWFPSTQLPFYLALEAGWMSFHHSFKYIHSSDIPAATRQDLAAYLGGGLGLLWHAVSGWFWGIHVYHGSFTKVALSLSKAGPQASQAQMQENIEGTLFGAGLNLVWGVYLDAEP